MTHSPLSFRGVVPLMAVALVFTLVTGCADEFTVVVDQEAVDFDDTSLKGTLTEGLVTLSAHGSFGQKAGVADSGGSYELVIEVDASTLASATKGTPLAFAGVTTFAAAYENLTPADVTWADESAEPVIRRAWVRVHCFCTMYGEISQHLSGTLVIDAFDGKNLTATVGVDLDGKIPFQESGFGGVVKGRLDAMFDVAL